MFRNQGHEAIGKQEKISRMKGILIFDRRVDDLRNVSGDFGGVRFASKSMSNLQHYSE